MSDLGIVSKDNLGSDFDLGTKEPGKVNVKFTTGKADRGFLASYNVTGDANASADEEQTLTVVREDSGWSSSNDSVTWTGAANRIRIDVNEFFDPDASAGLARINPVLELLRNGVPVAKSATGYQRHATGHDESSNGFSYADPNPVSGVTYRLRSRQGSNQNDTLPIDLGTLSLEAVTEVDVLVPIT